MTIWGLCWCNCITLHCDADDIPVVFFDEHCALEASSVLGSLSWDEALSMRRLGEPRGDPAGVYHGRDSATRIVTGLPWIA